MRRFGQILLLSWSERRQPSFTSFFPQLIHSEREKSACNIPNPLCDQHEDEGEDCVTQHNKERICDAVGCIVKTRRLVFSWKFCRSLSLSFFFTWSRVAFCRQCSQMRCRTLQPLFRHSVFHNTTHTRSGWERERCWVRRWMVSLSLFPLVVVLCSVVSSAAAFCVAAVSHQVLLLLLLLLFLLLLSEREKNCWQHVFSEWMDLDQGSEFSRVFQTEKDRLWTHTLDVLWLFSHQNRVYSLDPDQQ